jgi:hypothetical protein
VAEVLDSKMFPEEEEEEDLEDDDGFEVRSISFDGQEHGHVVKAFDEQMNAVTIQDAITGIYPIGCNLVDDFANRSLWDQEKNAFCKHQWAEWLAMPILDQRFPDAIDFSPLLFWNVITASSRW